METVLWGILIAIIVTGYYIAKGNDNIVEELKKIRGKLK